MSAKDPKSLPWTMTMNHLVCSLFSLYLISLATGLDNGVALTPPMGWLSWERFGCNVDCVQWPRTCISERLYLEQAAHLVSDGYRDAGYRYVQVDDCWSEKERDSEGNLVADKERFPSGMRYLADELHGMGLLFGLYGDIGSLTCAKYPGFDGHFEQDAQILADWHVDSIKVDGCYSNNTIFNETYPAFGRALNATGRPILYNCQWPLYDAHSSYGENPDILNPYVKHVCNQWRNFYDIDDSWSSVLSIIHHWSRNSSQDVLVRAAGPGGWNDPDMLVIGNPGLSISEQQAQFCVWAIFAAPLLLSADLRTMPTSSRDILLNEEVIAVNQDLLGRQGWCASGCPDHNTRVYVRELLPTHGQTTRTLGTSDSWAIVLANFHGSFAQKWITFDPRRHLPSNTGDTYNAFEIRDLLTHQDLGSTMTNFTAAVDESSVQMYRITLTKRQSDATLTITQ